MTPSTTRPWKVPSLFLCGFLLVGGGALQAQGPSLIELTAEDPAKIESPEACGECHISEYDVWKKTTHATGFKTLHRRQEATEIAERMGVSLLKRDSPCIRCHYTAVEAKEQLRAVAGVSCESCHGAGKDWINIHNDYGGKGFDHTNETPEHRAQRLERSRAAGMRRPSDLYPVVASCYTCHSVPFEELVNVGGHPAGSGDFELVARYQQIQHNFLQSLIEGDGTINRDRTPQELRLMYVVGRALEAESALRGVAEATEKGTYASAMIRRVRLATNELRTIERLVQAPQLTSILATLRQARVGLDNRPALLQTADAVGELARQFLASYDGSTLATLDPLVRGEVVDIVDEDVDEPEIAGQSPQDAAASTHDISVTGGGPGRDATAVGGSRPIGATAASSAAAPTIAAVPAVGEIKKRIRPTSQHGVVGPSTCTGCHRHGPQNEWWFGDAHYRSADRFFEEDPKAVQIARLYGIRPDRMSRGDQVCMDCHGTVVSGKEKREVGDGVGCESCHGAAADYLEPHQEGEPELGLQRPGYQKALQLGMAKLRDAEVRAKVCTGCHYITEPRLISAGHPSGREHDYIEGMATIEHWPESSLGDPELRNAFAAALQRRGAVPQVRLARLAGPAPQAAGTGGSPPAASGGGSRRGSGAESAGAGSSRTSTVRRSARASLPQRPAGEASQLDLPPFPEIAEDASIEEVLRLLEQRLEALYGATAPEGNKP